MQIIYFLAGLYLHHLHLTINFAMHKIKTGTLKAGSVKSSSRETFEISVARDNILSFMSPVKGTPEYWKQVLYGILTMVKQLEIPTYFLTFSCADLR